MSGTSIMGRCLQVLEILSDVPEGISLGDVSVRSGMPKSAAHRMLTALVQTGFVTQIAESRNYRLTMKLTTLGFNFLGKTGVIEHCQHILNKLATEVRELVRMTVVDGDKLVWAAKAQGAAGSLVVDPVMGRNVVLHSTANGKVWLASLTNEKALTVVLRDGLGTREDHGPNVIQSAEELLKALAVVRKNDYAISWEEAEPGMAAFAVGIPMSKDEATPLIGTVSVAGPVFRLTKKRLKSLYPIMKETAIELSSISSVLRHWSN